MYLEVINKDGHNLYFDKDPHDMREVFTDFIGFYDKFGNLIAMIPKSDIKRVNIKED